MEKKKTNIYNNKYKILENEETDLLKKINFLISEYTDFMKKTFKNL